MKRREPRVQIDIQSRDYWYKALENQQINWALIDEVSAGGPCTVYFVHELSGVFDQLPLPSQEAATLALRYNGFHRVRDFAESDDSAPPPPFFEDYPRGQRTYSSGAFWKQPPDDLEC